MVLSYQHVANPDELAAEMQECVTTTMCIETCLCIIGAATFEGKLVVKGIISCVKVLRYVHLISPYVTKPGARNL